MHLHFNGIDGHTGKYAFPKLSPEELADIARFNLDRRATGDPLHFQDLADRAQRYHPGVFELSDGRDPKNLAQAGWAAILPHDADPAILAALQPLLELRREQASKLDPRRFQVFSGRSGFQPEQSKSNFLAIHHAGRDYADFPYYLLIVGGPDQIPFSFQYQLDVDYAVGRIHFDCVEDYAQYAASVVAVEGDGFRRPRNAVFFGVRNGIDDSTTRTSTNLVAPLKTSLEKDQPTWQVDTIEPTEATKARLAQLMGGDQTPAFLFAACHGSVFQRGDPRQLAGMGSLVCADWQAPEPPRPKPGDWFGGDDILRDANLKGLVAFLFACFGAGTPHKNDFVYMGENEPAVLADKPFVSYLAKRLLAHPKGGALAVVGHVDRAWTYSFESPHGAPQLDAFQSCLTRLMEGHPVGSAMESFNHRYANLSVELLDMLTKASVSPVNETKLAVEWACHNDARDYVIIGDPAVRLSVEELSGNPSI